MEITAALLEAFRRHGVPEAYGFINGGKLREAPEHRAVLEAWVAAGHPLGNHTYEHTDLHQAPTERFLAGIRENESVLREFQPAVSESVWKFFRYPYLREGLDLKVRTQVRADLFRNGYRVAPVTIDPYDWAYTTAYARCMEANRKGDAEAIRKAFLSEARAKLRWADAEARMLVGRPIRQILLLHLGLVDADSIDALLTDYEHLGVRWVRLQDALEDSVYAHAPDVSYGGNYLFQLFEARGIRPAPPSLTPSVLLETMCK